MSVGDDPGGPAAAPPAPRAEGVGAAAGHLAHLDGLRAILALYVVQRHAEVHFWRVTESHVGHAFSPWALLRYAHFAVDVFIVISGFCLFLPIVKAGGELRHGASFFLKRRAFRILPPYYASFGASMLALWAIGQSAQFTGKNAPTVWHHLLLVHDALSPFAVNSALWSVAVECHIYLLFPLIVVSWRRLGAAATIAATIAAGAALYVPLLHTPYRVVTPQYLALFAFGMGAAAIYASPRWGELQKVPWGLVAAPLILGPMAFHHFAPPALVDRLLGVEDLFVGLGGAALLLAGARPGAAATLLGLRPLVFVGKFSYSVYLIHLPILIVLASTVGQRLDLLHTYGVTKAAWMAVIVLVATVFAYAFFLVCERPFLRKLTPPAPAGTAPR